MAFKIYTSFFNTRTFSSYEEARIFEALCIGLRMNYSLTYPDGETKEVEFKKNDMATIAELGVKIQGMKEQIFHLTRNKVIPSDEKKDLMSYYQNKINSYEARKKTLISKIEVTAEEVKS